MTEASEDVSHTSLAAAATLTRLAPVAAVAAVSICSVTIGAGRSDFDHPGVATVVTRMGGLTSVVLVLVGSPTTADHPRTIVHTRFAMVPFALGGLFAGIRRLGQFFALSLGSAIPAVFDGMDRFRRSVPS